MSNERIIKTSIFPAENIHVTRHLQVFGAGILCAPKDEVGMENGYRVFGVRQQYI